MVNTSETRNRPETLSHGTTSKEMQPASAWVATICAGRAAATSASLSAGTSMCPLRENFCIKLPVIDRRLASLTRRLSPLALVPRLRRLLPEVLMARINLFLQHFRSESLVGTSLMSSLEHLQLEAGFDNCPLNRPYNPIGPFTTRCWIRSLWESLDYCGVELVVDYPTIPKPRAGDKLLVDIFVEGGSQGSILESLQRCRIAWGLLFLSDMTAANGSSIERKWTRPAAPLTRPASQYDFPSEVPTDDDWNRWEHFWVAQFGASLALPNPLGTWLHKSHRIWEWFYHSAEDAVVHIGHETKSVYTRAGSHGRRHSGKKQYQLVTDGSIIFPTGGIPCSVGNKTKDVVILLNTGPSLAKEDKIDQTFTQFLRSWGGIWMWNNVSNSGGDFRWVLAALEEGMGL